MRLDVFMSHIFGACEKHWAHGCTVYTLFEQVGLNLDKSSYMSSSIVNWEIVVPKGGTKAPDVGPGGLADLHIDVKNVNPKNKKR